MRRLSSYGVQVRQANKKLLAKCGQSGPETSYSNLTSHSMWWGEITEVSTRPEQGEACERRKTSVG